MITQLQSYYSNQNRIRIIFFFLLTTCHTFLFALETRDITLEDVLKDKIFEPATIYGLKSMEDGIHYTSQNKDKTKIEKFSYETGEKISTILDITEIPLDSLSEISKYQFNNDENKILFYTNKEKIYRRSFSADYYIWNIDNKELTPLSTKRKQRVATFSPDGNKVGFVWKNNIYIKFLDTNEERQITFDGKYNEIQNGIPDWVYEEEFAFSKTFEWSPDSKTIAYIKFDESRVKTFNMTKFCGSHPKIVKNELYPENYTFKYPKPGEKNSVVSVHVYDLQSGQTQTMNIGEDREQYIPRIRWTKTSTILSIFQLNRLQNEFNLLFADPKTGQTKIIYSDKESEYIEEDNFDKLTFLDDNNHFIILNEKDGYNHIYLYDFSGKMIKKITKGNFDVSKFYGYDHESNLLFYQSNESSYFDKNIYSITIKGRKKKKLTDRKGTHKATFSKNFNYFINSHSSINTPPNYNLKKSNGKTIRILENNQELIDTLEHFNYSQKELFSFETSEKIELKGWIIKPKDFDKNKSYPLLMYQYSGPGSQSVTNKWSCDWYQYLSSKGIIIACVDGRGTNGRGEKFKKSTYMELGKYETIDQIEAAKYLGNLPFVDKSRIGIWGWSYGGFMTLLCMEKGEGIFTTGVAVAPVTNWRFYDSIYTERFMRTPQENPKGYDDNSPLFFTDQFQGNLLICHGSADDNVHMQNTMEFIEKLVQDDKQFDMMIYTNRNHSIYGENTRYHLFRKISDFILENL